METSADWVVALLQMPRLAKSTILRLLDQPGFEPLTPADLRDGLLELHALRLDTYAPSDLECGRAWAGAQRTLEHARRSGIDWLAANSPRFPARLRTIADPPVLLWVRGDPACLLMRPAVAVVGTRAPGAYGWRVARRMAELLASRGVVVVSGLARGCDSAGHEGCLDAGGRTVAFLAHGLHMVYPPENSGLAERILSTGGCLASEYAPGAAPERRCFVLRDRLQSGLSDAVLVIQTDGTEGTMHTARFCRQQGRLLACLVPPEGETAGAGWRGNLRLLRSTGTVALLGGDEADGNGAIAVDAGAAAVDALLKEVDERAAGRGAPPDDDGQLSLL